MLYTHMHASEEHAVALWLRHYATSYEDSKPDDVN
jgi:hypothetical protein